MSEATAWINSQLLVIPMVEDIEAVNNLDDILQVTGADVLHVAPSDLGQSLGNPGAAEVRRVMSEVIPRIRAGGVHVGVGGNSPNNTAGVAEFIQQGANFVTISAWALLRIGAEDFLKNVNAKPLEHRRPAIAANANTNLFALKPVEGPAPPASFLRRQESRGAEVVGSVRPGAEDFLKSRQRETLSTAAPRLLQCKPQSVRPEPVEGPALPASFLRRQESRGVEVVGSVRIGAEDFLKNVNREAMRNASVTLTGY